MTREEAIKWLSGLLDAYEECEHGDYFYDNGDAVCEATSVAIAALREQAVTNRHQLNGWISVEDRLPDDSAGVNLCTRSGIVGTGFYDKYTKNWVQYYSGGALCVDVTHWMPLPEPPELKEGDGT